MSFAKINHVAIVSERYALLAKFYETLFIMKGSTSGRSGRAVTVRVGYVGMRSNPRTAGRPSGLDHFGIEVDNIEEIRKKIHAFDPECDTLKRPPVRPFAAYSACDPDGNIFSFASCKGPLNYGRYCDPALDALLEKARASTAFAERKSLYEQAAAKWLAEGSVIYLYHRALLFAHSPRLEGFKVMPDGLIRVTDLKLT